MSGTLTGGAELRSMAELFDHLQYRHRAAKARDLAHEFDRMEAELTRLMQEAREAHAAVEELKA